MDSISYEGLKGLFTSFQREALHLEMRDSYGTAAEIPHLAKWEAGEPDETDWLQPWFGTVRAGTRPVRFPASAYHFRTYLQYQKWVLKDSHLFVEAGEDIRWAPRSRISTAALPGNDFWFSMTRLPTRATTSRAAAATCADVASRSASPGRGIDSSTKLGRHRWVVERTISWLLRFQRLALRYDRTELTMVPLLILGMVLINLRRLVEKEF